MLHDEEQMVKVGDTIRKLQEKGEFSAEEVWRTRKDGSKFPSLMNGMLIMDDDGKPIYLSATAIDITDIKKHEKEIRDLNQNLEKMVEERTQELLLKTIEADKANRAKSEFLSRMSHELRTPMNSILGFAQLLDMGEMLPAQKRSVHHILRSGNLLLNLINEVLDISRIEAGRLSLSIEPVMVQGVIQEMIDSLQPMFREKEIQVTVIESAHNGLSIKVDKQRLKQIILNLLNNAVKYNKTHGQITIACDGIPDSGNLIKKLRISVEDTGIGIAKEDIEKLFMPFERIGAERTETEGTGLGLAVVKKLVDAMGGWIGVESTKDVGSKFWVEFPLADNTEHHVTPDVVYKSPQDKSGNTRGTIVYIEDNKPNIELVEQIIAEYCPETHLVTHLTGAGAKELVRMVKPNLILLDLNLPEKDGDTVLTEIKTDDEIKDIPVVVISADAMPKKIQQLMKQGALEYLTKPLDVVELVKVIRQYFKGG
jgi:signal transduction histidine kinase